MKIGHLLDTILGSRTEEQSYSRSATAGTQQSTRVPGYVGRSMVQDPSAQDAPFPEDSIHVSTEAAYMLAGSRFDPRNMTDLEVRDMADLLLHSRAISMKDHQLIVMGPEGKNLSERYNRGLDSRDMIAGWQERMARDIGSSNLANLDKDSRALTILGRVAAYRKAL